MDKQLSRHNAIQQGNPLIASNISKGGNIDKAWYSCQTNSVKNFLECIEEYAFVLGWNLSDKKWTRKLSMERLSQQRNKGDSE